jgi:hypothetical protein
MNMKKLKRMLAAIMVAGVISAGAFAQKPKEEPKRPPKDPDNKVVVKEKPAPNNNSNSNRGNRGDRKP